MTSRLFAQKNSKTSWLLLPPPPCNHWHEESCTRCRVPTLISDQCPQPYHSLGHANHEQCRVHYRVLVKMFQLWMLVGCCRRPESGTWWCCLQHNPTLTYCGVSCSVAWSPTAVKTRHTSCPCHIHRNAEYTQTQQINTVQTKTCIVINH